MQVKAAIQSAIETRLGQPVEARDDYRRYLQLAPEGANTVFIRAIVDVQEP